MSVEPHLLPTHSEAIFNSMQAERTVTRIAFNPSTASPGDVLYFTVPKLSKDVVMVFILASSGVFYPQALDQDLTFELTLAPASQVVGGSDTSKLVYKLKNIQLEYARIRSKQLADAATTAYTNGKEFAYDQIMLEKTVPFNRGTDADFNLMVNPQRRSLKGILLLFIVPYTPGARDTENYFNPDIINIEVTINGTPNRVYNNSIKGHDMWREASRLFSTKSKKQGAGIYSPNMTLAKYLTGNKFRFFLDLRSMAGTNMHGSGQRLVNSENGMQIAITRNTAGSGKVSCHVFSISDAQLNIMERQLLDIQF